jgi:putative SOS response-associated peptidase YedK
LQEAFLMMNRGRCAVPMAAFLGYAGTGSASGIVLADRATAPLLVIAALWLLFFAGLGAAHWRARRAPP